MAKKLIMVVDDEADNRTTVKEVLEGKDYHVITAVNGDDCLDQLKKVKPALILMDIMMPGTPVKEVLKKIKGIKVAYLSVVRVSEAEKEDLTKSKNIIGFIEKPFETAVLRKKVNEFTSKK